MLSWIKQASAGLIGQRAEKLACDYLRSQGYQLVTQNYRCRSGEIDLIMRDEQTLVFVEVKFRSKQAHGQPVEFFHSSKRRKFESAMSHYFQAQGLNPEMLAHRIDVVGIELNHHGEPQYNWLQNV